MSDGEGDLVDRARAGDRRAFGKLVEQHQRRVYATARRLLGDHADADDVAQEAFLRAYRGLANFDGRSEFFTWLYRIVMNVALNHIRAAAARAPRRLPDVEPADPTVRLEAREQARRTTEALLRVPGPIRAALVLHVVEGLPQAQVARILECAEGTVAWRVSEGRKMLRELTDVRARREDIHGDSRGQKQAVRLP